MPLLDQIVSDMKDAMRAKDESKLSTLRMLKSALKNKEIDLMHPLTESEVLDVVKVQAKQLKEAMDQFEKGGRADLAESNAHELSFLKGYLPEEMSDAELEVVVKEAVIESGATNKADMGKIMGFVMKAVAGRADGSRVKAMVEKILGVIVFAVFVNTLGAQNAHAEITLMSVPEFGSPVYTPYLETGIRLLRVAFLFVGLMSLIEIIRGGIEMTVGSARDDVHHHAEHKIMGGFMNTGIVLALFLVTTVVLNRMS